MIVSPDSRRVSSVCAVRADGIDVPPVFILQAKSITDNSLLDDAVDGAKVICTETGIINESIAIQWMDHFGTHAQKAKKQLLLVDNHKTHVTLDFVERAEKYNFLLLAFPGSATHFLQPLDYNLFASLKQAYANAYQSHISSRPRENKVDFKQYISLFTTAYKAAFSAENVKASFNGTGIWPINKQKILDKRQQTTTSSAANKIPQSVQVKLQSFEFLFADIMGSVPAVPKKKTRGITPSRLLTSTAVKEELKKAQEKTKKRAQEKKKK